MDENSKKMSKNGQKPSKNCQKPDRMWQPRGSPSSHKNYQIQSKKQLTELLSSQTTPPGSRFWLLGSQCDNTDEKAPDWKSFAPPDLSPDVSLFDLCYPHSRTLLSEKRLKGARPSQPIRKEKRAQEATNKLTNRREGKKKGKEKERKRE